MFTVTARVTPFKAILLKEAGWRDLAALCLELLDQQARDGVDSRGGPLMGTSGKPIDLHDKNRLFTDVDALLSAAKVTLRFNAPYADTVERLYRFAGLSQRYRAEFDRRAAPIVNKHIHAEV